MLVDGAVPGGEDDGVVGLARRCRDAGQRRTGEARGEAGHDAEADARAGQRQRLFAAASEDERIAAFEAEHPLSLARQRDQPLVDVALMRGRLAAALAGSLDVRARSQVTEHARVDQLVVHDDVAAPQGVHGHERQQARIARPGADEPDLARIERRKFRIHRPLVGVHRAVPRKRRS